MHADNVKTNAFVFDYTAQQKEQLDKSEFSPKLPSCITFCRPGVNDDCTMYGVSRFPYQTSVWFARYLVVTSAARFRSPVIGKGATTVESFM